SAGVVLTYRPGAAGGGGRHPEEVVVLGGAPVVRAGHLLPGGAVPARDQGLEDGTAGEVAAHRPGAAGGGGGHPVEDVLVGTRARARLLRPAGAVPVLDQRQVPGVGNVMAHRPDVAGGDGCRTVQEVTVPWIGTRLLGPRSPVPARDQGLE